MTAKWNPPASEAWYWSCRSPSDTFTPTLQYLSRHVRPTTDSSYGRLDLPYSPEEVDLQKDPSITWSTRQVFYDGVFGKQGASDTPKAVKGSSWICYQVWHKPEVDNGCDLIYMHGITSYGGDFAPHARPFLDAGYRIIAIDFPGHGRSSGLHVYLGSTDVLSDAVHLLRQDLRDRDAALGIPSPRKTFCMGQSMGGFTAISYSIRYGSQMRSDLATDFPIAGTLALCPMLAISPETYPPKIVEYIGRAISSFLGWLPLADANKGKDSDDPAFLGRLATDPQTYHGKLRVATGLSIVKGITDIANTFSSMVAPLKMIHGTGDRVTSYKGSEQLLDHAGSQDKQLKLFDGYEHVLLRKGRDEQDDVPRQLVLKEMIDWLATH